MNKSNLYRVFLLRLWREQDGSASAPAPLRIMLEEPSSGRRSSFPSLEALLQHLQGEVQRGDGGPGKEADQ